MSKVKSPKKLAKLLPEPEINYDEEDFIDELLNYEEEELPLEETLILQEHQIPHVEKLSNILENNYCAFDMSVMGAGKTYTTTALSMFLEFNHLIVICPASVEAKWNQMKRYGVNLTKVLSYGGLKSKKGFQPKHGLLSRIESPGDDALVFLPTDELIQIVREGCLFVFDEAQNLKNDNSQFQACQTITNLVVNLGGTSRFILLSGTPIDKEDQSVNIMRLMGIIRSSRLYNYYPEDNRIKRIGAQELIDFCNKIDPVETRKFLAIHPFTRDKIRHNCYLMFQRIVKKNLSAAMPSPVTEIDCKNGYYKIEDSDDKADLVRGIESLQRSLQFSEKDESINITRDSFAGITKALIAIEAAKVMTMARIARKQLKANPKCKVGIFVNYTDSIVKLKEELIDFGPLSINGQTAKPARQTAIKKFQEENLKHRVFIANIQVASTGIDLDDKNGEFPRHAYISPSYRILDLHQLTRRFTRLDTKSVAHVRFFYGNVGRKETSILNSLARKTAVLKETLDQQAGEGILFPGEYAEDIEK